LGSENISDLTMLHSALRWHLQEDELIDEETSHKLKVRPWSAKSNIISIIIITTLIIISSVIPIITNHHAHSSLTNVSITMFVLIVSPSSHPFSAFSRSGKEFPCSQRVSRGAWGLGSWGWRTRSSGKLCYHSFKVPQGGPWRA
jgi:hypothetical protein